MNSQEYSQVNFYLSTIVFLNLIPRNTAKSKRKSSDCFRQAVSSVTRADAKHLAAQPLICFATCIRKVAKEVRVTQNCRF